MYKWKIIKDDERSIIFYDFRDIIESLATLNGRFLEEKHLEFSPFDFTEQSAVSAFMWAAGSRQRLALAEYQVNKSSLIGGDLDKAGRADLWIDFPDQNYTLEFKVAPYKITGPRLKKRLKAAQDDAGRVDPSEHDHALGVLVAFVKEANRIQIYEEFASDDEVRFAARIGKKGEGSCYIYMADASKVVSEK